MRMQDQAALTLPRPHARHAIIAAAGQQRAVVVPVKRCHVLGLLTVFRLVAQHQRLAVVGAS